MPSPEHGRSVPSASQPSVALRTGAGVIVVAAHIAVAAAIFFSRTEPPRLEEPEAVLVSVIEAPVLQNAQGEPEAEPQPEPPIEAPAPEPEVEPPVEAPPEPEIEPPPEPEPEVMPEPEPEPEPVVEDPPEPVAKKPEPPPEPKPQPKPKPEPKPQPKPKPKPQPKPKPAESRPVQPKPATPAKPVGTPDGNPAEKAAQAPRQGPMSDDPMLVSNVEYDGRRPMPSYPMMSRRLREEGRVVVMVLINTQGQVQTATIDQSSGHERLDQSALAAARKARFKPFMRNGVALPARARLPFDFKMRN